MHFVEKNFTPLGEVCYNTFMQTNTAHNNSTQLSLAAEWMCLWIETNPSVLTPADSKKLWRDISIPRLTDTDSRGNARFVVLQKVHPSSSVHDSDTMQRTEDCKFAVSIVSFVSYVTKLTRSLQATQQAT